MTAAGPAAILAPLPQCPPWAVGDGAEDGGPGGGRESAPECWGAAAFRGREWHTGQEGERDG